MTDKMKYQPEYKIIEGEPPDCQKILNQWRHEYELYVLKMVPMDLGTEVAILLTRTRKHP